MLASAAAKRFLLIVGLVLVALLIFGLVRGAIGSAILGSGPLVPQPEIHLPPQPVFPASTRDKHLGLAYEKSDSKESAGYEPAPAKSDASHDEPGKESAGKDAKEEHHSEPLGITQFAVTNTMLSAWIVSIVIILFFVIGAGRKSLVPGRFQGLVETIFEGIINFSAGVLGQDMARKAFPVVATIFFFVLFNAWLGLLPIYQFLGFVQPGDDILKAHLIRPAGTDLNMPLALALVSFVFVEFWGFKSHGFGYLKKFFAFGSVFQQGTLPGPY